MAASGRPIGASIAAALVASITFAIPAAGQAGAVTSPGFSFGGIVLNVPRGESLDREVRPAIARALARLPRAVTDHRLVIERRHGIPCTSDGLPSGDSWWDARTHQIALCDGLPRDLARQVVLAAIYAFDADGEVPGGGARQRATWSESPAWHLIAGWRTSLLGGVHPFLENKAPPAHVGTGIGATPQDVRRAMSSPRWDLVTFAASMWLDDGTGDDRHECRLMSHARFLRESVRQVDPTGPMPVAERCPRFEEWADLENLEDIEVVLAAPSSAMVGSLFGHLLLNVRYRASDGSVPLELGRTVAFLADNDAPFREDPAYALKGIAGTYTATLHERSLLRTYREYVINEGRDLRRWRLMLSAEQKRRLLERVWTLEQGGTFRYYFFARNCATLLVDLVNGALDLERPIEVPGLLAAPPSSILERFEAARTVRGEPLVRYVPEPILALEHQARLASQDRRDVERRLLADAPNGLVAAAATQFAHTHAVDSIERARAYSALVAFLEAAPTRAGEDVRIYLRDSALLESHLAIVANIVEQEKTLAVRRGRLKTAVGRLVEGLRAVFVGAKLDRRPIEDVASDDPERRLAGYMGLRAALPSLRKVSSVLLQQVRLLVLLQSEVRYDVARMKSVPGLRTELLFVDPDVPINAQPYLISDETSGEASQEQGDNAPFVTTREASSLMSLPTVTRVSEPLRALQRAREQVFAARELPPSDSAPDAEGGRQEAEIIARQYHSDLPRSGIDQFAASGAVAEVRSKGGALGAAPRAVGILISGALYDERLGEHRRFGFPSHTALTVGRSRVFLEFDGAQRLPLVYSYDARVVGYRSLKPTLPEATGSGSVGWEMSLDARGSAPLGIASAISGAGGLLKPLWGRDDLSDYVLFSAGVAYEVVFPSAAARSASQPQVVGLPLGFELRQQLPLRTGRRSSWTARAYARPGMVVGISRVSRILDLGATVECHLALRKRPRGGAHDPAFVVAAQVARRAVNPAGGDVAVEALLSAGIDLR